MSIDIIFIFSFWDVGYSMNITAKYLAYFTFFIIDSCIFSKHGSIISFCILLIRHLAFEELFKCCPLWLLDGAWWEIFTKKRVREICVMFLNV